MQTNAPWIQYKILHDFSTITIWNQYQCHHKYYTNITNIPTYQYIWIPYHHQLYLISYSNIYHLNLIPIHKKKNLYNFQWMKYQYQYDIIIMLVTLWIQNHYHTELITVSYTYSIHKSNGFNVCITWILYQYHMNSTPTSTQFRSKVTWIVHKYYMNFTPILLFVN